MTTVAYLSQLINIDRRIKDKYLEAMSWKDQAMCMGGGGNNADRVQTSKTQDKMAEAVAKYVDLEKEAEKLAEKLSDTKIVIIKQIDAIENQTYYNILKGRYLYNQSYASLSLSENYSETQIRRLHKRAISEFERKYGDVYMKKGGNGNKGR